MSLIKVKTTTVVDLPKLWRLALKCVYDRDHFTHAESQEMQSGIEVWNQKIELDKLLERERVVESHRLGLICLLLVEDEEGKLDKQKWLFKQTGVDYRKFYRLPGANTPEDFARGLELKKESDLREGISNGN